MVDKLEPGSFPCPTASYPLHTTISPSEPLQDILETWTREFNACLSARKHDELSKLFTSEGYWRDQLCVSWTLHTLSSASKISQFLRSEESNVMLKKLTVDTSKSYTRAQVASVDTLGNVPCILGWYTLDTTVGKGRGIVRLVRDSVTSSWQAFTLYTTLQQLTGHEEMTGLRREVGGYHDPLLGQKNWQDIITEAGRFENKSPTVLVIGSGQSGLTVAARLKQLGVLTLVIDKVPRIGDSWRNRYRRLVLHDPVWYDHLPYLPFPDTWPIFTPKDKLAGWFELYAQALELIVWTNTMVQEADYDDAKGFWTVKLNRLIGDTSTTRVLRPKHVIFATGLSGEKNFPSQIPGMTEFKGDRLCHSSEFPGAKGNGKNKNAVVVGSSNSAHDIAQDFYEEGYTVTMVQRSSTYVARGQILLGEIIGQIFKEDGLPIEDADLIYHSTPFPVIKLVNIEVATKVRQLDAKLQEGLAAAGFKTNQGPDNTGLALQMFQRGGGYYIDIGCSQLIVDGKIRVVQGTGVASIGAHCIRLEDGRELEADEIIFATGYQNMSTTARKIFPHEAARLDNVWGLNEEAEPRKMWTRTRHPGMWFMGGNLALARFNSRLLALQIKAIEVGLMK